MGAHNVRDQDILPFTTTFSHLVMLTSSQFYNLKRHLLLFEFASLDFSYHPFNTAVLFFAKEEPPHIMMLTPAQFKVGIHQVM